MTEQMYELPVSRLEEIMTERDDALAETARLREENERLRDELRTDERPRPIDPGMTIR